VRNVIVVRRVLWWVVLLFALSAYGAMCAGPMRFEPPPPPPENNSLGVGDIFQVRVFNEAELSQEYRVAPDGTIDFPYLGRVRVAGLEPSQVADHIQHELRERRILTAPQVSVFVREVSSRRIDVVGQVARPGSLPFTPSMTIVQAISGAGGFTQLANRDRVVLTRTYRGTRRTFTIPVQGIIEGRYANVVLAPGDVVNVPENPL
jgi:protein involved in polysaccharide export with SLBB domain